MSKAVQQYLPLELTPVKGSPEFTDYKKLYELIDKVLLESGLDLLFSDLYIDAIKAEKEQEFRQNGKVYSMSEAARKSYQIQGVEALRCNIVHEQEGLSYRQLNIQLAANSVLQNFCQLKDIGAIKVPSRSQLHKYSTRVGNENLAKILVRFNEILFTEQSFIDGLSAGDLYLDSTCIKANMRYPVDWLLIRDGCRTMLKAITLIRKTALKCRMQDPKYFESKINGLCIKMAAANRKRDEGKARKAVLREMKKLEKVIRNHAQNHLKSFKDHWHQTLYTKGRANTIIHRLLKTIEIMPAVIYQAHERIIGGRLIGNADKILSLYQEDVHVITRRKSEAHNEFGSQLLIAEQEDGFIVGFIFEKEKVSNEGKMLPGFLEDYEKKFGKAPESLCTDRGFSSPTNLDLLKEKNIYNAICPKSPVELQKKLQDPVFRKKLKRRGPNEGRIGIVKNNFMSSALKAYSYERRHKSVHWGILTHNLVKLARLLVDKEKEEQKKNPVKVFA